MGGEAVQYGGILLQSSKEKGEILMLSGNHGCLRTLRTGAFAISMMVMAVVALPIGAQDGTGRLEIDAAPVYHSIDLVAGFDEPYTVEMIVGGTDVDLFRLTGDIQDLNDCAGFTTTEPMLRISWSGADKGNSLALLFESEAMDDDPTMFVHVVDQEDNSFTSWCNDDDGGQYDPMVEISTLPINATITLWIGSYYPAEIISGTLYILQTVSVDLLAEPSPTPGFGSIWSETQVEGGLLIEEYCRAITPAYPDARPLHGEDLSWACWVNERHNGKLDLTAVCDWQYGPGSYAVQLGNSFRTYACYRRDGPGSSDDSVARQTPTKVDYGNARNLPVGGRAMVITSSGRPLPVYRGPALDESRFTQLPPGSIVDVLAGPVYADGAVWWEIQAPGDIQGWAIAFGDFTETLVVWEADTP